MQANWACATAKQSGPAHVHCHRPELRCAPASEEELPAEETAVHPASDTCKLVQTARTRASPRSGGLWYGLCSGQKG